MCVCACVCVYAYVRQSIKSLNSFKFIVKFLLASNCWYIDFATSAAYAVDGIVAFCIVNVKLFLHVC